MNFKTIMGWFSKRDKERRNCAAESGCGSSARSGSSDERTKRFQTECLAAEGVVNNYCGVLERTSELGLVYPESLLLRPKAEIKAAIGKNLLCLHLMKRLDRNTYEMFKTVFSQLALFVNDADARSSVSTQADLLSGDPSRVGSPAGSAAVSAALRRFTEANEESAELAAEFDAMAVKLGIQL